MIHPVSRKTLSLPHRQTSHARSLSFFLSLRSFFILSSLSLALLQYPNQLCFSSKLSQYRSAIFFFCCLQKTQNSPVFYTKTQTLSLNHIERWWDDAWDKQTNQEKEFLCLSTMWLLCTDYLLLLLPRRWKQERKNHIKYREKFLFGFTFSFFLLLFSGHRVRYLCIPWYYIMFFCWLGRNIKKCYFLWNDNGA